MIKYEIEGCNLPVVICYPEAGDIQVVQGAKNVYFGSEGLFHTRVTGPGKAYIQSIPTINTALVLTPYLSIKTGSDDGGINIRLGD